MQDNEVPAKRPTTKWSDLDPEDDYTNRGPWPLRKPAEDTCTVKEEEPTVWVRVAQYAPYVAEFLGCLLQALAWNCIELGKTSSGWEMGKEKTIRIGEWKPLVMGLTLMVSTYSFATVSGAHLNPAVSISVGLSNLGDWVKIAKFIVAQTLGSAAGVALSCATYRRTAVDAIGPRNGFHMSDCAAVEFLYTMMVCVVYLNVTCARSNNSVKSGNQFYALAIGFAVASGCWASEDVSGAIFNPGLALSIDFQNVTNGVGYGFTYVVMQLIGAFMAAVAFRLARPDQNVQDHEEWTTYQVAKNAGITYPKMVVEGMGTAIIVFTFGMTTLSKTYSQERPFSAAAALMSLHYALADVSGGHFNPAVTVSVVLSGRGECSVRQGLAYFAVQVVCASIAGFLYTAIRYPHSFPAMPVESEKKYGRFPLSAVDCIYAVVVCYTALATITVVGMRARVKRNNFDGLAYGLSSAVGGFALLQPLYSLANPALTLGEALAHTIQGGSMGNGISISFGHFIGAVIASCLFRFTHAGDFRRHQEALQKGEEDPLVDNDTKQVFDGAVDTRLRQSRASRDAAAASSSSSK